MLRTSSAVLVAFVFSAANASAAPDPAEARLEAELKEILRAPELQDAFAGVHVRSLKRNKTLFEHNGGKLFNPASNMKILTTATALWYLGPTYRFRTEARRDDKLVNGVLQGNLYIKGYGDPTLTTEELFGFVNQIALRGIRKITGHVIIDDTFFDGVSEGPGWDQEIGDHAYAAPIGALSVNFNTFEVRTLPGDRVGEPVKVEIWPPVPGLEAVSSAYTRGHGARSRLWIGTTKVGAEGVRVTVRGTLPINYYQGTVSRKRVHAPSHHAGWMIHHLLEMRGIDVRGRVKIGRTPPRGLRPVATHFSKPLAEIVSTLNKYSNNFMAEQILKTVGAELSEPPGSWDKGNAAIRDFLVELGIQDGTFVLANGSGLNDTNRVTPRQIVQVLQAMYQRFELRPEFMSSLAVAGRSGTITRRFENSPAQLRLRAKTGSLTGVSALSGYVVTPSEDILVFSVMMNDYQGRARTMWRIQDRIGIALARFRGSDAVAASTSEPNSAAVP